MAKNKQHRRKKLLVDARVQGALAMRAVMYWCCWLLAVAVVLCIWRTLSGPRLLLHEYFVELWYQFAPAIVVSILLLPLVVFDVLRFSNRFVGPVYRLKRSMKDARYGEVLSAIRFRDDDFWQDVANEFNALMAHVNRPSSDSETTSQDGGETDGPSTMQAGAV